MNKPLKPTLLALAVAAACCQQVSAQSNEANNETAITERSQPQDKLERIVVTGVPRSTTVLESSTSVSSVLPVEIERFAPRSTAEVFRHLPGIRAESSGGGGNANITIRGIPLATGGSKFMQLQEDGLPVMEFGDIIFGNADNFLRIDASIARVESIRGGSASTFASNSPGGIINMISKTGELAGGSVSLSSGLDYDEFRTDFEFGGDINNDLMFHLGGFVREGEGAREAGYNSDSGFQLKGNVTKQLDNGYVRVYAKHLDDNVITYLPSPVQVKGGGNYGSVANYDASSQTLHTPYQTSYVTVDAAGNRRQKSLTDGIHSKVSALGFEAALDFDQGWSVLNKMRYSSISGGFIAPFTDGFGEAAVLGAELGGAGASVTYANGPNAGAEYSGLAFKNLIFDVDFDDLGLFVNDFKLTKSLDNDILITAGLYKSRQNIATSWASWGFYLQSVDGKQATNLNVVNDGISYTDNGLFNNAVVAQRFDLQYYITAPYANIAAKVGKVDIDVSVRRDFGQARGSRASSGAGVPFDINGDGQLSLVEQNGVAIADLNNPQIVNYDYNFTSYSVGANYMLTDRQAIFGRYSLGGRAGADRLFDVGVINADGSVVAGSEVDEVKQLELGYKHRGQGYNLFVTAFDTTTDEINSEITSGGVFQRQYKAYGVELEGTYYLGDISISGNATWTDAEIKKDLNNPAVVGNTPRRQADLIFSVTPEYSSDNFTVGANLVGSTDYYVQDSNEMKQKGYTLVNLFFNYFLTDDLTLSLNINNLTDEFIITESEEGFANTGEIIRARPLNGRTSSLSLRYSF
ncbi:TonB-dependent receptor [Arsukibacterium sp.]|uniref:TonB-dependent receptor domain-containing protein n=1 Tax=Arsukibacterium sp. TaxID=1977258 RepID=UPI001BD2ED2A|nr:TonB-dependent receptor [Arsukibacterium sp.]